MIRRTLWRVLTAAALTLAVVLPIPGPVLADSRPDGDAVVIQANTDLTIDADTYLDAVVLFTADATILGEVGTVVVVDGTATLSGARVGTLVVAGGAVEIGTGSIVDEVRTIGSTYHAAAGATVGSQSTIEPAMIAAILAPVAIAAWLGLALAYLLASLVVAAIAGDQLRRAGAALTSEAGSVTLAALAVLIGTPLLMVLLAVTVIGIPTALLVALVVLPLVWFVGSIAAAVRIGDWLLLNARGRVEAHHPMVAALLGILVVALLSVIPLVGFLIGLAGAGAVLLIAWRAAFFDASQTASPTIAVGPAGA